MPDQQTRFLRVITPAELGDRRRSPIARRVQAEANDIVRSVREGGDGVLREFASRFDGLRDDRPLVKERPQCDEAASRISVDTLLCLERVASRIRRFAEAQHRSLAPIAIDVPGGMAGHDWLPVHRAGCYAPGGRYPLVSSVLMTIIPARVAGVGHVTLATPNPSDLMLAAAAVGGADQVICCGGAHAIAALAYGTESLRPVDVIAGPGNQWVTAAKQIVSADVRIDMLAGPSELVVIADGTADPAVVAADLLAQAEHDVQALPILITTSPELLNRVECSLSEQLELMSTRSVAEAALSNGFALAAPNLDDAIAISNTIAPEHLQVVVESADAIPRSRFICGALFVGPRSAEVFADFGIGPNHVLPTGGSAQSTAGLSVFTFMRAQTWLQLSSPPTTDGALDDALTLAKLEGLPGHEHAGAIRR